MTIYLLVTVSAINPDSTRNQACGFHRKTFSTRFHRRASWPCGHMRSVSLASIIRFTSRQRAHRRTFTLTLPFCQAQLHRKVWLYVFLLKIICILQWRKCGATKTTKRFKNWSQKHEKLCLKGCLSMPLLFFSRKVRATCGEVKWILSEQQGDVEGERWLRANNLGLSINRP